MGLRSSEADPMLSIHPNARTTPAVRAEIARSTERTGILAQRYGVSTETIRKWRQRGPEDCRDRSARPHQLPWKASEEERAVVCALRRATGFPLDDLTFVVRHFLPHLDRDNVYRILRAEGLSRRPPAERPEKKVGTFKDYELGFVHLDIKHLPKLRTADGECRKRYLFVAIDRRSRWVHLAVRDDETEASAVAFLKEALRAFPFRVTHLLTDRGSCFTADRFEKACRELGVEHRKTRPYTPRTNGMVERFNGRVQREVLGITIHSHRDLERLLQGFNQAYNARRQRVLDGRSPKDVVRERLAQDKQLASPSYEPPADPCVLPRALMVVEAAKEVSQPDSYHPQVIPATRRRATTAARPVPAARRHGCSTDGLPATSRALPERSENPDYDKRRPAGRHRPPRGAREKGVRPPGAGLSLTVGAAGRRPSQAWWQALRRVEQLELGHLGANRRESIGAKPCRICRSRGWGLAWISLPSRTLRPAAVAEAVLRLRPLVQSSHR
jgi:transposase